MTTRIEWSKLGLKLICETSKRPVPKTSQAFPLPDFGTGADPFIQAVTEFVATSGKTGIRVTNKVSGIPTTPGKWFLQHTAYVGTAPAILSWDSTPITPPTLNLLFDAPLPEATHRFRLLCQSGAFPYLRETIYAEASVISAADEILAALEDIGNDGILSATEKPAVIIDYNKAVSDYASITAKATAAGVSSSAATVAFNALQTYILGLNPTYSDTSQNTTLYSNIGGKTPPECWTLTWTNWFAAYLDLMIKLLSAPPSTARLVESTTSKNLTTNGSAPVIDGVTSAANDLVILAYQSPASANGSYFVRYTAPQGGGTVAASTGTASGDAGYDYIDPSYALDTNTANWASLSSPDPGTGTAGTCQVIYSGWSGTWTDGTFYIEVTPYATRTSIQVHYSTDSGSTWALKKSYTTNSAKELLSIPLTGITPSAVRIRVTGLTARIRTWDPDGFYYNEEVPSLTYIHQVYVVQATVGSANYYFEKQANVVNQSIWRVTAGTARGGKTYLIGVDGSNNLSFTAQTAAYEAPLPVNSSGTSKVLQDDGAGNKSWVSGTGGSGVTSVTASGPLSSSGGATPNITIATASSGVTGALTGTDWNTFNGKVSFPGFGTSASLACVGNDGRLSDSRPASDVYSWAKAATKPTYSNSEIVSYLGYTPGPLVPRLWTQSGLAAVSPNLSVYDSYYCTLNQTLTVNNPTAMSDGQAIMIVIIQDATGGRSVSWGTAFRFLNGGYQANTAVNGITVVSGIYSSSLGKWICSSASENPGGLTAAGVNAALGYTAASTTGSNCSGSWGISVTGSSASCTGNAATATNASATPWSGVSSKPTTLSGYSIANTDVTAQTLTNYSVGSNAAIVAGDTILGAMAKIQAQINAKQNASGSAISGTTGTFSGGVVAGSVATTLGSGASYTPAVNSYNTFVLTLTASGTTNTINAPTGTMGLGQTINIIIIQPATISAVPTWNAAFKFFGTKNISTTANGRSMVSCIWDGTYWQCTSVKDSA